MIDGKIGLGKPKIEMKPAAKRNLAASPRRFVRSTSEIALTSLTKAFPPVPTMQAGMRKQVLLEAEIRRQRQLQAVIPKTTLTAMKFADMLEAIAVSRDMLEAMKFAEQQPPLLSAWKVQQALWKEQTALLQEFRIIDMPHFVGWPPDSEPVAIVRCVVHGLRDDKAVGDELEKIVGDDLPAELHKQLGIKVLKTDKNLHLHRDDENGEIDLAVYCDGDVIFIVEVKKTIDKKKIAHFLNKNARLFIESKCTLSNEKIFGLIAYANSSGDAVSFAKKQGLLVCRIAAESELVLADPPSLQQLCDLRSTNLDKPKTPQKHHKKKLDKPDTPHEWINCQKNRDGTALSFKVTARPTRSCRNYLKKFLDRYDNVCPWLFPSCSIAEEVAGGYIIPLEKFVTDALLGWENVIVCDGAITPFSVENAARLFKDFPRLYYDLVLRTYKLWCNNSTDEAVQ